MKPSLFYLAIGEMISVMESYSQALPEEFKADFEHLIDKYIQYNKKNTSDRKPIKSEDPQKNTIEVPVVKKPSLSPKIKRALKEVKIDYRKKYTSKMVRSIFSIRGSTFQALLSYGVINEVGKDMYMFNKPKVEEAVASK